MFYKLFFFKCCLKQQTFFQQTFLLSPTQKTRMPSQQIIKQSKHTLPAFSSQFVRTCISINLEEQNAAIQSN